MTLQQATLPVPRFDQLPLADLKQQIQQALEQGQQFLDQLTEVPVQLQQQLDVLAKVDQLENIEEHLLKIEKASNNYWENVLNIASSSVQLVQNLNGHKVYHSTLNR